VEKLHYEERNDLYYSQNIIRVIKSRRMRWAGPVACMGGEAYTGSRRGHLRKEITWKTQAYMGG